MAGLIDPMHHAARPSLVNGPAVDRAADQILSAMQHDTGHGGQGLRLGQQATWWQKAAVQEVMCLDAGAHQQARSFRAVWRRGCDAGWGRMLRRRQRGFPVQPAVQRGLRLVRCAVVKGRVVRGQQGVRRLAEGEVGVGFGAQCAGAVQEPREVGRIAQKGAAQQHAQTGRAVACHIGERQGGAPRAAHQQPGGQSQMTAQRLHVGHQVGQGVVLCAARWLGAPASTLVEQGHVPARQVEEREVACAAATARAAMQHHGRAAARGAVARPPEAVAITDIQPAGCKRVHAVRGRVEGGGRRHGSMLAARGARRCAKGVSHGVSERNSRNS